ncbi:MAG TPA: hypothetical protein ENG80_02625 [Nitrospirae bacterium]|nr:hypothetical protein BMS3Abin06_02466 [bacterium BMS3Abin06]HDH00688.1 hypothetical protein [Nitrospirota bacterium]HDZ03281.1 hypothetical protein [Nitrospirota bacterium]
MTLFKKIPVTFADKDYEIRVLYDDASIHVIAFLNNHPANGYRYQIKIPTEFDVERVLGTDVVEELVEMSKNDIIEKRWENLLKVMHENKQRK